MSHLTEIVKIIGAREKVEKEKEVGQGEFPLFSPHKVALSHAADPVWEQLTLLCNFISMAGIISHSNYF